MTKSMALPASPHPKQWKVPCVGRTLNDGVFSSWKGHRPFSEPAPARRSATYSPTTSSIRVRSRTSAMSLSRILPATTPSLGGPTRSGPPGRRTGAGSRGGWGRRHDDRGRRRSDGAPEAWAPGSAEAGDPALERDDRGEAGALERQADLPRGTAEGQRAPGLLGGLGGSGGLGVGRAALGRNLHARRGAPALLGRRDRLDRSGTDGRRDRDRGGQRAHRTTGEPPLPRA